MSFRSRSTILLSTVVATLACAQEPAARAVPEESDEVTHLPEERPPMAAAADTVKRIWRWSDAQLRGVFDIVLPDTQERGTWELEFQPRVWDLSDEHYVRVPFGATYGFNRRTEGEIMLGSYFANPWDDFSGVGIATIRGGFKHRWKPTQGSQINAASGFEITRPVASSPAELNQGINRASMFITASRRFMSSKELEGILNLSYDLITPSSADGFIPSDMPQNDFFRISPGVLHHRGRLTYGLSAAWSHTVDGPATDFYSLTPSVIYEIPPKYVFNSPGRWQVGLALEGKHYADGNDLDVRLRVRWLGSITRVYKDWRDHRRAVSAAARGQDDGR